MNNTTTAANGRSRGFVAFHQKGIEIKNRDHVTISQFQAPLKDENGQPIGDLTLNKVVFCYTLNKGLSSHTFIAKGRARMECNSPIYFSAEIYGVNNEDHARVELERKFKGANMRILELDGEVVITKGTPRTALPQTVVGLPVQAVAQVRPNKGGGFTGSPWGPLSYTIGDK